jgi:hypothetical protein
LSYIDQEILFNPKGCFTLSPQGEENTIRLICKLGERFSEILHGYIVFQDEESKSETPPMLWPSVGDFPCWKDSDGNLNVVPCAEVMRWKSFRMVVYGTVKLDRAKQTSSTGMSELIRLKGNFGFSPVTVSPDILTDLLRLLEADSTIPERIEELEMAKHTHPNKPLLDSLDAEISEDDILQIMKQ